MIIANSVGGFYLCVWDIDKSWVIYDNNYRLFLGVAPVITFLTVCPPLIIFVLAGFTLSLLLSHDLYATWELGTYFPCFATKSCLLSWI